MILKQLLSRGSQLCTAQVKGHLDPNNCPKILVLLTGLLLNGGHGGGQAPLQLLVPSFLAPSNLGWPPAFSASSFCFPRTGQTFHLFSTPGSSARSSPVPVAGGPGPTRQILVRKVCNMSSLSLLFVFSSGPTAFSPVQRKDNLDRVAEE